MKPIDADQEEEFARTLAAYDDALARGASWAALDGNTTGLNDETTVRLAAAKKLLRAIELVWPRAGRCRSNPLEDRRNPLSDADAHGG